MRLPVLLVPWVLVGAVLPRDAAAQTPFTRLVSTHAGVGGAGHAQRAEMSAEGRFVVFESAAADHVPGDVNGQGDVFLTDTLLGTTELISRSAAGVQGNGRSGSPAVSADGRYIAFLSAATNLVANDANGRVDVFVRDRAANTVELVSRSTAGVQGSGDNGTFDTDCVDISADGTTVAFASYSSNLTVPSFGNGFVANVYVRHLPSGVTTRESYGDGGQVLGGADPTLSGDGRYVAYLSSSFHVGGPLGHVGVYLRDRQTGTQLLADGTAQGGQDCAFPDISDDGSLLVFATASAIAGDTNGAVDVYAWDVAAGALERVSDRTWSSVDWGAATAPSVSATGRFVAFYGRYFAAGESSVPTLYVEDRTSGELRTASVAWTGVPSAQWPGSPGRVSSDGETVVFASELATIAPGDANAQADVFQHVRPATTPSTALCTLAVAPCPCAVPGPPWAGCQNVAAFGSLSALGVASVSNDSLVLVAATLPPNASVLFFQGTAAENGGLGTAFGDGARCAGGATRRLAMRTAVQGASSLGRYALDQVGIAQLGLVPAAGGVRTYQAWYRDPSSTCTPSTFNLTNGLELTWAP